MNKDGIPASAFMTDDEIPGPRANMHLKPSKEEKAAKKAKQQAQKEKKDLRETQKDNKVQQEEAEQEVNKSSHVPDKKISLLSPSSV
jgi:hypothetical protein